MLCVAIMAACLPAGPVPTPGAPPTESPLRAPSITPLPPKRHSSGIILVTLPGARADLTDNFLASGGLPTLAQVAAAGAKAGYLQPIDPVAGAAAQASLLSGVNAARTGIVSDRLHLSGTPAGQSVRGLDLAPAVEPVWRSAMRFGARTAVIGYTPAALDLATQRADWMVSQGTALAPAAQFVLKFTDARDWKNAPSSLSPLRESRMTVVQAGGSAPVDVLVLALDTTDDHQENYDTWLLSRTKSVDATAERLRLNEWASVVIDPLLQSSVAFKVTDASPAHFAVYQSPLMVNQIAPPEFAREITQRFGAPPAPPDDDALLRNWIEENTYVQMGERQTQWLTSVAMYVNQQQQPDVLLLRLTVLEDAERALLLQQARQPGYKEHTTGYAAALRHAYDAADAAVGKLWGALDLSAGTLLVLSPYGMTPTHTSVNVNRLLNEKKILTFLRPGVLDATKTKAYAVADGGLVQVYLSLKGREPNGIVETADADKTAGDIASALRELTDPTDGQSIFARVLRHADLSALGMSNDNAGDVVAQARPGYRISEALDRSATIEPATLLGASGYSAATPEMHGIFFAAGAGIRSGARPANVNALDVAPTIAALLRFTSPVFLEGRVLQTVLK
jgi:predicted AlkP superfamily phosphohydrolase/phosphomutase